MRAWIEQSEEGKVSTPEQRERTDRYLSFVSKRTSGELLTTAAWLRKFVTSHHAYKNDSVVLPEINYDLMIAIRDIAEGKLSPPELLGLNLRTDLDTKTSSV
jgi:glutamate--cysteine ligase catalytic subunit